VHDVGIDRLIALVALAGTYLGLALGRLPFFRVDRTGVAIIGGAIVVVSGLLPWDRAVAATPPCCFSAMWSLPPSRASPASSAS